MFNQVVLVGNLTRDPELKHTTSGTPVANFGIATNRKYGENKEEVYFGEITAWGKLAEICAEHLQKGSMVLVEGRLITETWHGTKGEQRSKTKIIAQVVKFLDRKANDSKIESPKKESMEPPTESSELEPF